MSRSARHREVWATAVGGEPRTCAWCGRAIPATSRPGPPRRYCRPSHRQRAYEARLEERRAGTAFRQEPRSASPKHAGRQGISIGLLGPVEVIRDGGAVSLPLGPRRVVATLAMRPGRVHSAEDLVDRLWPGVTPEVARHRLQTAVWKVRRALDPARDDGTFVRWESAGYLLDIDPRRLDWFRFRRLHDAGQRALDRGASALARVYLTAAIELWRGDDALAGITVAPDDLAFIAEQASRRARAARALVDARLQLGEFDRVIPELEAIIARDPLDETVVWQLAVAHHRVGDPGRALELCRRYQDAAEGAGLVASAHIADLQTAILRRDPEIEHRPQPGPAAGSASRPAAFLSASWDPFAPSPAGPVPGELLLDLEELGGSVLSASPTSVEASFSRPRPALRAALELQRSLAPWPRARIGIRLIPPAGRRAEPEVHGPPRGHARLLAAAALGGQVLTSGLGEDQLRRLLPDGATLRALGSHRLNALTSAEPIFQLVHPSVPSSDAVPGWLDEQRLGNLPEDPSRMFGREREIAEAIGSLGESRMVTLVGAPGSGKTRLAIHVAAALAREFRDGVRFVGLDSVTRPDLLAPSIATVLQVPRRGGDPLEAVVRHLRDRHLLLVLDNCEHLLAACREIVDAVLPAAPGVTVLATSREAFRSQPERLVWIPPLEPPPAGPLERLPANPAMQLFYDRVAGGGGRRGTTAPPSDAPAVARICRAVDGLPLALVLAAARARDLGPTLLADALEEVLGEGTGSDLLSVAGRPTSSRETLEGTMGWSYRLLEREERELFESLSVFRGPFTLDDATAICGGGEGQAPILKGLERLVRASLVIGEDAGAGLRRFRLLQPVRDFASSMLASRDHLTVALHRRHADHFLSLAEVAEPTVRGPQDPATIDRLERSLPDLYGAIRWAIDREEAEVALRLVGALWAFWLVRGRITEGRQMLEAALAADVTPSRPRIRALVGYSCLSWFAGDLHAVREGSRQTLDEAGILGDEWGWAYGAHGLAALDMFDASNEFVPLRIEEVVPHFRRLGDPWDTGLILQALGGAAWHRGRYEHALRVFAESMEAFRSIGHPTLMASLRDHGLMLALLGDMEAGAAEVDESVVAAYQAGDLAGLAQGLCRRAAIARYGGHADQARTLYREALRAARQAGEGWSAQWALDGLGSTEGLGLRCPRERLEGSVEMLIAAEELGRMTGIVLAPREREAHARDMDRARARLGEEAFRAVVERARQRGLEDMVERGLSVDLLGQSS